MSAGTLIFSGMCSRTFAWGSPYIAVYLHIL
uniref:Uncharacterized protein n=1 Tax=Siphoviridae sp. ctg0K17 TaxID=2825600 RepID=A0A8S5PX87_9CAUD|nr:MAG TPA: hypothetical protein [Siphoviridae sp. ctg0K17]